MINDYTIIGSISGFSNRYMPLERIPSFDSESSIRIKEVGDLKHKDETDIEFMESLYRNSNPDYYLGGWIVKSVVDILLEFTIGDLPTIQATDKNYTKFSNNFWNNNQSQIYALIRELGLFGQEFAYIGYDRIRKCPKIRPLSKACIIDIRYEDFNDPDEITYVRFREQFSEVETKGTDEFGDDQNDYHDVFYDKIFWKEQNPKYSDMLTDKKKAKTPQWIYKMKILKRKDNEKWIVFKEEAINPLGVIPIVEFNQNKLSFDKVGHSDLTGAMKIISIYHQVLESTINNALYNSQPTLKFTGIESNPIDFVKQMYGDKTLESGDVIQQQGLYEVFGSYYLARGEDVNWLTTPSTVSSSKEILNLLFYILVQVTGVPEWCLGAGMEGAWATVKQQSVPLLQKIRSKRMDITDTLMLMNRVAYIVDRYYNPISEEEVTDFTCQIIWGDVLTNDMDVTLRLVEFMLQNNFITKETAVSIIGLVNDPLDELKKAQKAVEKERKKQEANDNVGTLNKLMQKKAESNAEESDEEDENADEEVEDTEDGEMVSKVATRVINMLLDMPDAT